MKNVDFLVVDVGGQVRKIYKIIKNISTNFLAIRKEKMDSLF